MTKQQELEKLDAFIVSLGSGTYIGPWLYSQRPQIERALLSDVDPSIYTLSMDEFREHREQLIQSAEESCASLKTLAEERSRQWDAKIERTIDGARAALHKALADIDR